MKLNYILCGFIVLTLLAGCAKPPKAEIDNAKELVSRAAADPAVALYGSNSLKSAQESLRQMQVAVDSKRFDSAKTYAELAANSAQKAIDEGIAGRANESKKGEADSLIAKLKPEIEETERNINNAGYRGLKLDYNQLRGDLKNAKDTLEKAENDQNMSNYTSAREKADSVRVALSDINRRITDAVPRKKS